MQAVACCRPLLHYFSFRNFKQEINRKSESRGRIALAFGELVQQLKTGQMGTYCTPTALKDAVTRLAPRFGGYHQQDSQEFLKFLLDGLHEDLNRVRETPPYEVIVDRPTDTEHAISARWWENYQQREDSPILDRFCGQFRQICTCERCRAKLRSFLVRIVGSCERTGVEICSTIRFCFCFCFFRTVLSRFLRFGSSPSKSPNPAGAPAASAATIQMTQTARHVDGVDSLGSTV